MAKIKLMDGGFTLIPEGVTTFKIVGATYDEEFGSLEIELQTKNGQKHIERFSLVTADGEVNEGATKAFSYFAKTALNNYNLDEIDEQDLVGCYITATVKHESYTRTKGTRKGESATAVRLKDYAVAVGFGSGSDSTGNADAEDEDDDLDDFLNDD